MSRLGDALWRHARLPRTRIHLDPRAFLETGLGLLTPFEADGGLEDRSTFEAALAAVAGRRHALAVGSGKAALAVALDALQIPPGSEVVVPSLLVPEVVAVILAAGLEPVIVDVDPDTFGLAPATVEEAITPATRAILPVHIFGTPCAVDELSTLAAERGLLLLEDAAQAVGATVSGRAVGSFGVVSTVSLGQLKNVSTLLGGAVLTDDDDLAGRMRAAAAGWPPLSRKALLQTWSSWAVLGLATRPDVFSILVNPILSLPERLAPGWTKRAAHRPEPSYATGTLDLEACKKAFGGTQARLGMHALAAAGRNTAIRAANAAVLDEVLAEVPGISTQRAPAGARSIRLNYPLLVPDRDERLAGLRRRSGIDLSDVYVRDVGALPAYEPFSRPRPVAARVEREHVYVPVQHELPPEVFRERAERLARALAGRH